MTFEVSWAYGETTFINARDEAHAERVAAQMSLATTGDYDFLGKVKWVRHASLDKVNSEF